MIRRLAGLFFLPLLLLITACGAARVSSASDSRVVGTIGSSVVAMIVTGPNTLIAAAEDSGIVRSTDGGTHWMSWSRGVATRYVSAFAMNTRGDVFAATIGSGVYRLKSGATEWERIDTSAPKSALARVPAIAVSGTDNTLLAATLEHGVYRSTDNGATWRNDNVGLGILNINAITVADDNVAYARCVGGGVFRRAPIWDDWKAINEGLEDPYITTVGSQHGGTTLLGTRNGKVYRLDDARRAWEDISGTIPGYYVNEVGSTATGVILAATKSGVYRCKLSTRVWTPVDTALAAVFARSMAVSPDGRLFVGDNDGSIYVVPAPAE